MRQVVLFAAAAMAIVTAAAAQPPAQRISDRQANYKQMNRAMHGINDQLRSSNPSIPELRAHSAVIARFAPLLLHWFPHGSGPEAGVRTRALPEIWSDHAGFTRAGAGLVVAARALDAAARRGDVAAVRAALPAVRQACSACHDDYRAPEN